MDVKEPSSSEFKISDNFAPKRVEVVKQQAVTQSAAKFLEVHPAAAQANSKTKGNSRFNIGSRLFPSPKDQNLFTYSINKMLKNMKNGLSKAAGYVSFKKDQFGLTKATPKPIMDKEPVREEKQLLNFEAYESVITEGLTQLSHHIDYASPDREDIVKRLQNVITGMAMQIEGLATLDKPVSASEKKELGDRFFSGLQKQVDGFIAETKGHEATQKSLLNDLFSPIKETQFSQIEGSKTEFLTYLKTIVNSGQ